MRAASSWRKRFLKSSISRLQIILHIKAYWDYYKTQNWLSYLYSPLALVPNDFQDKSRTSTFLWLILAHLSAYCSNPAELSETTLKCQNFLRPLGFTHYSHCLKISSCSMCSWRTHTLLSGRVHMSFPWENISWDQRLYCWFRRKSV